MAPLIVYSTKAGRPYIHLPDEILEVILGYVQSLDRASGPYREASTLFRLMRLSRRMFRVASTFLYKSLIISDAASNRSLLQTLTTHPDLAELVSEVHIFDRPSRGFRRRRLSLNDRHPSIDSISSLDDFSISSDTSRVDGLGPRYPFSEDYDAYDLDERTIASILTRCKHAIDIYVWTGRAMGGLLATCLGWLRLRHGTFTNVHILSESGEVRQALDECWGTMKGPVKNIRLRNIGIPVDDGLGRAPASEQSQNFAVRRLALQGCEIFRTGLGTLTDLYPMLTTLEIKWTGRVKLRFDFTSLNDFISEKLVHLEELTVIYPGRRADPELAGYHRALWGLDHFTRLKKLSCSEVVLFGVNPGPPNPLTGLPYRVNGYWSDAHYPASAPALHQRYWDEEVRTRNLADVFPPSLQVLELWDCNAGNGYDSRWLMVTLPRNVEVVRHGCDSL